MTDESDPLLSGYARFRQDGWTQARAEYEALAAKGQKPHTLVVACSDSRADPALIFDAAPGQLFVVRNVANIVPPYQPDGGLHGVSAALEFGVRVLGVERIVVMGHALCGGVNAMINGAPDSCNDFVRPWVAQAEPVVRRATEGWMTMTSRSPANTPWCACRSTTCGPSRGLPSVKRWAILNSWACISASPTASCGACRRTACSRVWMRTLERAPPPFRLRHLPQ